MGNGVRGIFEAILLGSRLCRTGFRGSLGEALGVFRGGVLLGCAASWRLC